MVQPGGEAFTEAYWQLGDLERKVYDILVELRCAPYLLSYSQVPLLKLPETAHGRLSPPCMVDNQQLPFAEHHLGVVTWLLGS